MNLTSYLLILLLTWITNEKSFHAIKQWIYLLFFHTGDISYFDHFPEGICTIF